MNLKILVMKRLILLLIPVLFLFESCKQKPEAQQQEAVPQFNNKLTEEEKAGGVMTPEMMWKFGRLGTIALSPDGASILYTVTDYDLATEASRTNIFKIPVEGGESVQLTNDGGSSPQWFDGGKSIAFLKDGKLWTMNADGSGQNAVSGLENFEIFNISPSGDRLYFTRRVKLEQDAKEKYNMPKANVRIINDLMYRHWNYWFDYSYSHVLVAKFNGSSVSDEKDIMQDEKFESPDAPYFDETEISWSPTAGMLHIPPKS
jgi:Tol biopolymer transport system component